MPVATNRFAVSLLSRTNKAQAVNEEMMVDKETGQILLKTSSGDIISYDSLARHRSHIERFTNRLVLLGLRGDINDITLDNVELPTRITSGTNLMPVALTLKVNDIKKFMFSIDVETIELSASDRIAVNEPTVALRLEISKSGTTTVNKDITGKVSEINSIVLDISTFMPVGTDLSGHTVKLTQLTVTQHASYTGLNARNILHSVLVFIE